ncbi:Sensor histidine kinase LnrJ [Thermoflexales bacterium]|nr:Sensor histidine kinase LnrJ [Thermoflexales bacterium]
MKTQSQRIVTIIYYVLLAIIVLRAVPRYGDIAALALLATFLLLLVSEPGVSKRWSTYRWIYFAVQTALGIGLGFLMPEFDFLWGLYIILAGQLYLSLPRRAALIWMSGLIIIAGLFLMTALGVALGLAILLNFVAVGSFMISFGNASWQAEVVRNESAALLHDLQTAHAQLQDYADRAEELSAVRERNRVARELHDSVNQTIFSITLTVEAAQTILGKDPGRVLPYLTQLQDMTSSALAQLRSLIGQLRPKSDEPAAK